MGSTRWRKLLRDLWLHPGRTATMTVAVALGVFGLGTMLGAYAILTREMGRNYMGTHPASATLELDSVSPALVAAVRARPGIADADAHASLTARMRVGDDWRPIRIFVIGDFAALRIGTFRSVAGAAAPPT
ncbi:MAG TPA: hypothetical protein VFH27_10455, partial [Longimicrobiaceae bacterium]|nr:hypothetical protein [Longimicrobiaceae bacterium]